MAAPLGSLRAAEHPPVNAGRLAGIDLPTREPLRWLTGRAGAPQPPPPAPQPASADGYESLYVEFAEPLGAGLQAGMSYEFAGLDTDSPTLRLGDGTEFSGTWEEVVGTCVVFTEEGKEKEARVRHAGHSEVKLVLRRK